MPPSLTIDERPDQVAAPAEAPPRRAAEERWPILALAAAVLAAYGHLAVGRLLAGYDVTNYSLPNRFQVTEALRRFSLPAWDPLRFGGVPLLANPQTAVFYPLHWPLLPLPADRAQTIALVLHVAIAAAGTYALATRVLRTTPLAGFVAGVAFALGGFVHAHIGHFEQTTSLAWLPWALFAADRAVTARTWRTAARPTAGVATALALTGLAGHTQYLYMALAAVALYALVVARPVQAALRAAVGIAVGLLVAAVQLVPTALLSGRSIRSDGLSIETVGRGSLPLRRAVTTFLPWYGSEPPLPVEQWGWLACTALALAAIALVVEWRDRRTVALAVLAGGGLLLALGTSTPLFRPLFAVVPGMESFREPARWLLLPALALALLAGRGIDAVRRAAPAERRAAVAGAVAAGVALLAVVGGTVRPPAASLLVGLALVAGTVGVWLAVQRAGRGPQAAMVLAAVVTIELLAANAGSYVRSDRMAQGSLLERSATAAAIGDPGGRVLSLGGEGLFEYGEHRRALRPNTHVYEGLRSIDGYDGGLLVSEDWAAAMAAMTGKGAEFARGRTVRDNLDRPVDAGRFLELDTTTVVVNHTTLDMGAVLPPGSQRRAVVDGVQIWDTPTYGPVFLAGGEVPAGLRLDRDPERPDRLVVHVPAAAAGRRVVISEALAPGWSAPGDVELERHHDLLMSFEAPPGGGTIVLAYRTPGLLGGAALTLVGLLAVGALLAAPRWAATTPGSALRRRDPRPLLPIVVLLVVTALVTAGRGDGKPSERDDSVFLQAAYLQHTEDVSTIESITRAAENQFGWTGSIAERLREEGDIQTYALIPLWSRIGDFETGPSPWGRDLYVESPRLSRLSQLWFVVSVFLMYWAVKPLGRGVALAAALLLAVGHPFREGPALFDPWVMPAAVGSIGLWIRDRHVAAAVMAAAVIMVKPNYLFLLPAFMLAALVRSGRGDRPGRTGLAPAAVHAAAAGGVIVTYLVLGALDVIYLGGYNQGVRAGYDPAVLGYSLVETVSFTYRAGTRQLREHWPIFPWTVLNAGALVLLAGKVLRGRRIPRTAALVAGLIAIPIVANFAVIANVHDYEDGGHFRWINVSILGMAIALPLAYREVARLVARWIDQRTTAPARTERPSERTVSAP